jgi:hypothetical protein
VASSRRVSSSPTKRLLKGIGLTLVILALAAAGTGIILVATEGQWPGLLSKPPNPEYAPQRYILPQEPFEQFPVVPVAAVKDELEANELVLGVTVGEEARAYPLKVLNEMPDRKVANDTLGGQAIAATWCDACRSGIVFAREVEGRTLTLAVAGQLWRDSMILYDRETGSRWSQLSGEAKVGPLEGKQLRRLPAVVTDWAAWSRLYPKSTVVLLPSARRTFREDFENHPQDFVLGIGDGPSARAWGLDMLRQQGVRNDEWDGRPVLVVFDVASSTAALYERTLPSGVLTFRSAEGQIGDEQGGSMWNPVTGEAEAGPLRGQRLRRLPAVLATRMAWDAFHPAPGK